MKTVLLVDDESEVLEVLQFALEAEGFAVHCATSEEEALDVLKTNEVDTLVTDFHMPHGNGLDLIRRARKISSNALKCLLVTGIMEFSTEILEEVGRKGIVQKPFNLEQLIAKIES